MRRALIALSAALALSTTLGAATAKKGREPKGEIRFMVNLDGSEGRVACALFERSEWLEETKKPFFSQIRGKRAVCVFSDVPPGTYAISAFHDENENNELDTNFLGIPTEDWCTSRNASGFMGPPSFDDAKFVFKGGKLTLRASM